MNPLPTTNQTESNPQLYEVLASKRSDMKDVGEEFMDAMLKGFCVWKSAAGRDLLRWGFMVLQKPVRKQDGVLGGFFSLKIKTALPEGQGIAHLRAHSHTPPSQLRGSACDAHIYVYTLPLQ